VDDSSRDFLGVEIITSFLISLELDREIGSSARQYNVSASEQYIFPLYQYDNIAEPL
jgi:hypothetical protein